MSTGLVIGLTGGIGSGKSTVASMLVELGAVLFDADAVSRELTAAGGAAMPAITEAFGAQAAGADGALDRARMRALVFEDETARRTLEGILHPMIAQRREALMQSAAGRPVVLDIPLLTESPRARSQVDRIVVVDCREATQMLRVSARSGLAPEEVQRIMASQADRASRRALADAIIYNDGLGLDALRDAVSTLWRHWGCGTIPRP